MMAIIILINNKDWFGKNNLSIIIKELDCRRKDKNEINNS